MVLISCQPKIEETSENDDVVAAYIVHESDVMPDLRWVTQINYAFGLVDQNTFDRIIILNESRFAQIAALKEENPEINILLSLGGWGAGGFSEMAADSVKRKAFALDCKRIVDKYNIDGIDVDWEYPSSDEAGISATPDDINNFTLLIKIGNTFRISARAIISQPTKIPIKIPSGAKKASPTSKDGRYKYAIFPSTPPSVITSS